MTVGPQFVVVDTMVDPLSETELCTGSEALVCEKKKKKLYAEIFSDILHKKVLSIMQIKHKLTTSI